MKLEKFFRQKPVFTNKEFAEFQGSRGPLRARAPESLLAYHKRTGPKSVSRHSMLSFPLLIPK